MQVRVRATVQIKRDPRQFASSEWSDYVPVRGITTLPPVPTPPRTDAISPSSSSRLGTTGLLLLIIFLLISIIVIVVVVTAACIVAGCYLRK